MEWAYNASTDANWRVGGVDDLLIIFLQYFVFNFHSRKCAEPLQGTVHFVVGQRQRLALLERQELLDGIAVFLDQVRILQEQLCTLGERRLAPGLEGASCCLNRGVDIFLTGDGDLV